MSARQNWENAAPRNYSFVFERHCYCAGPNRVRVRVRGGKVAEVQSLPDGQRFTDPDTLRSYPTVEELLSLIDRAVARKPDNLTITYDRYLGYPSRIYIDYSYRVADDEIDYRLSDLRME